MWFQEYYYAARKSKSLAFSFTGFWVNASFLEAQKEDSKMFLIQMQSQSFTCKKQFFAYYLKKFLVKTEKQILQFVKISFYQNILLNSFV